MKKRMLSLILVCLLLFTSCSKYTSKNNAASSNTKEVITSTEENSEMHKADDSLEKERKEKKNTEGNFDTSKLSSKERNWFFKPKSEGVVSEEPQEVIDLLNKYAGYYVGDTSKKELYLTFDEGYENGYTSEILDILKNNNVKAAFFVTTPYIKSNKDLIKRMVAEGHLVCNHSHNHPSMAAVALKGKDSFEREFSEVEKAFEEVAGCKMPNYFRPPQGKYSELSLFYTKSLGYKSIFWSSAHADWEPKKQPSLDAAKKLIRQRTHNGSIILLHAVSKTNTEILDSVIKEWKDKGYELKSLDALPKK